MLYRRLNASLQGFERIPDISGRLSGAIGDAAKGLAAYGLLLWEAFKTERPADASPIPIWRGMRLKRAYEGVVGGLAPFPAFSSFSMKRERAGQFRELEVEPGQVDVLLSFMASGPPQVDGLCCCIRCRLFWSLKCLRTAEAEGS